MTEPRESEDMRAMFADENVKAWMEDHLPELRQAVSGHGLLYWSLTIGFVVGLAAHVAGYELLVSTPREPLGLMADLLHALGWSLWTGVVVVLFVQIIPEVKKRQFKQTLAAYEAFQQEKTRTSGNSEGLRSGGHGA